MKKFSKESMQQFMLMHAEKLILGACLAATGLFVWMSIGGDEKASSQSPSDLLSKADSADRYINKPDAWSGEGEGRSLAQFRKGKVDAKEQIVGTKPVDGSKFKLEFMGTAVETLAPRKDPLIFAPEQMIARRVTTAVMMNIEYISPLEKFAEAPKNAEDQAGGFGGFDQGGDDYGGDDFGPGRGSATREGLLEEFVPLDRSSTFNDVNAQTMKGIRPAGVGISEKTITNVLDVVCVTAVVDFKKQRAAFENAFGESVAYNTRRDRPVYQFLQVQRREVSDQGNKSEWKDISEDVTYKYARSNPLKSMPFQVNGSAPEVISPDNFDPVITQAIPAFSQLDYQDLASHPALKTRREFPDWQAPKVLGVVPGGEEGVEDFFNQKKPEDEMGDSGGPGNNDGINSLRNGTETESYKEAIVMRKPGGQYRLVRFFDLVASKKRSFEYRVRVWVGDPNQLDPSDGFQKNRGMQLQVSEKGDRPGNSDSAVQFSGTGDGMSGMSGMDQGDDGMSLDGNERPEVVQDVKPTMLIPKARQRIAAGTDFEVMQEQLRDASRTEAEDLDKDGKPDPITPFHVAEYSKEGKLEQIELPPSPGRYAYIQYLRFARPSAWSDSVRIEKTKPSADVMAGTTVRTKALKIELGRRTVEFEQEEPSVKVLVSSWVRTLGARLPSERDAYVGETMNFNDQAYVTHPISWTILVPENSKAQGLEKYTMPFRTNVTIVDAFFGGKQQLPSDKKQTMELATEILTMDANGNLKVSNQFAEATDYRNELAMPDDSRFYGRERRRPKKEEEEDDYGDDYE